LRCSGCAGAACRWVPQRPRRRRAAKCGARTGCDSRTLGSPPG
jgi:hypothetical protein